VDLAGVRAILARHAHLYRRAYVHGSMARGLQDGASDVDLVDDLGRADVLISTEEEERRLREEPGRYFLKDVFASGVLIEGTQGRGAAVASAG